MATITLVATGDPSEGLGKRMTTSIERWSVINQHPAVVHFFGQVAHDVGIRVVDTDEEFTCHIHPDRVDFEPSIDHRAVDFVVDVSRFQVDRLADEIGTGALTDLELYRIMSVVFTPAAQATLQSPIVRKAALRMVSGIEDLIHVRLISPAPQEEPNTEHTVLFVNRQWIAIPGLWGEPARTFELSVAEALAYHRKVVAAARTDSLGGWFAFTRWYRAWRVGVSHRAS